jgi:hypothetical protein
MKSRSTCWLLRSQTGECLINDLIIEDPLSSAAPTLARGPFCRTATGTTFESRA